MFYKRIASYLFKYPMPIWKLVYKQLVKAEKWKRGVNQKTFLAKSPYNQIAGWEHNGVYQTGYGYGRMFNMILQDGTRSDNSMTDNGNVIERYDYFLPRNNKITAVTIHYKDTIRCFRFHLSDGSKWCIGQLRFDETVTVNIADNEEIVGFKAKSLPNYPAEYTEFQFITARGLF